MNKPTAIRFLSMQTKYGVAHTAKIAFENGTIREGFMVYPARPADAVMVAGKVTAKNGSVWAVGRTAMGDRLVWKSVKVSKRYGREAFRMRSVPGGYKGDFVTSWSRTINGKTYSFTRIFWNAGKDGATLRVYAGVSTVVLHEWNVKGPVSMKKAKNA